MLKKLELHNFKSHHQTQFNFDNSRLQAIIGQNSSGKTSVLQSLYCLSQFAKVTNSKREDLLDLTLDIALDYGSIEARCLLSGADAGRMTVKKIGSFLVNFTKDLIATGNQSIEPGLIMEKRLSFQRLRHKIPL